MRTCVERCRVRSELTGSALPTGVRPLRGAMLWMLVLPGLWASCSAQGEWGAGRTAWCPGRVPPEGGRATNAGGWSSSPLVTDFSKSLFAESI